MGNSIRQSNTQRSLVLLWLLLSATAAVGQTEPVIGLHTNTPRINALTNARIVARPGEVLPEATLLVRDGTIEQVGAQVDIPSDAVVRDLKGKTIYPGFIDLYTNYGIGPESDGDTGGAKHWNPAVLAQRQASTMLSPDSSSAENLRKSGFCAVLTFPQDGIFKGTGAFVLLGRKSPNQTILAEDLAQAMSLRRPGNRQYPASLMGVIALIRQTLLDAQWYEEAWAKFRQASTGQTAPETNLALAALYPYVHGDKPVVMQVSDELDILRASKIAREFGLDMWVVGSGSEYRRLEAVKGTGLRLIVPVNFPKAPDVSSLERELHLSLRELRHWDFAPENPGRLAESNVDFVLTTAYLKSKGDFLQKVRLAVQRGLPEETAIEALTTRPAEWLGISHILGTLASGKLANFTVTDGEIFDHKTRVLETWVAGERFVVTDEPEIDIRGRWTFVAQLQDKRVKANMKISGSGTKLTVEMSREDNKELKAQKVTRQDNVLMLSLPGEVFDREGWIRITGIIEERIIKGHGHLDDGSSFDWHAEMAEPQIDDSESEEIPKPVQMAEFPVVCPDGAFGRAAPPEQPDILLIRNATIWTCGPDGILSPGDLLVKAGKIAQIGRNLSQPEGAAVIDATGKHLTPGLIDAHSHLAIRGGGNEATHAVTSEVRIEDVINSDDINIYRQLAGGLTTSCILHGSANPIGGTYAVIKLRWGALPDELFVQDAKPGLKLALGENVKRSSQRYPDTRMGTVEIIRDAFVAARDYRRRWQMHRRKSRTNRNLIPPRTDLRLECFLDILDGTMLIHCHAYRQDEIQAMLLLAEQLGIKFDVFIHVLEGYKVAEEMKQHGAMATTFSDWWAYKMEAYDAIGYNGAILYEQDVVVSFNSDSVELARRMNTEASKAVKYGHVPPEEALKFITLNAAQQLCLDDRIGSLETGKDADFVVWSRSPLSTYSLCEQTWIDGRKYFDIEQDKRLRETVAAQRTSLIQKILNEGTRDKKDEDKASEQDADPSQPPERTLQGV
ncbi:MAG: amidohydrolase family protein [Phycisphaerales bacterium]|nr:MAG: amidohydrolase family protein [Phycisphaerales bacterium]